MTGLVVLPYQPRLILLYAGDNDIAAGKSARRVFEDWRRFIGLVHAGQPTARIVFLSIKPSHARWSLWPEMQKANDLIRDFCGGDNRLFFTDLATLLLGPDGTPEARLFLADQLHLNVEGYAVWSAALVPVLPKILMSSGPKRAE